MIRNLILTGGIGCVFRPIVSNREPNNPATWYHHYNQRNQLMAESMLTAPGATEFQAYWLNWSRDSGLYFDLPCHNPQARTFLTSLLTGCYFGIQRIQRDDGLWFWRVRHYNMEDIPIGSLTNFEGSIWLVPEDYRGEGFNHRYAETTAVWGEYNNATNDWEFFYQKHSREERPPVRQLI
jgi:hypothetical protein